MLLFPLSLYSLDSVLDPHAAGHVDYEGFEGGVFAFAEPWQALQLQISGWVMFHLFGNADVVPWECSLEHGGEDGHERRRLRRSR